ncbi:MAG: chromosome partitioning protein [Phototrophicales bacterium]|nr:MAG: chromosome partitioning protein [Phototrophicales bacterium]
MTIPVIAFFNNKGGVGKTSLVYHLGWMYDQLNIPVLLADLDPQANLTTNFLDDDELETFWEEDNRPIKTIYDGVKPLITGKGDIDDVTIKEFGDVGRLIAGDLQLSRFEGNLSDEWSRTILGEAKGLRTTSAIWRILQNSAQQSDSELILVDMGPNLGAINRTILLSADYIVIPLAADLFSLQGLKNLGETLHKWKKDWNTARSRRDEDSKEFEIPEGNIQPLGYIVMQHAQRLDRPVKAYANWIQKIPEIYARHVLNESPPNIQPDPHQIGLVRHYVSLMAMAHDARKPIFYLKPADGAVGSHVKLVQRAMDNFEELALAIANRIGLAIPQDD